MGKVVSSDPAAGKRALPRNVAQHQSVHFTWSNSHHRRLAYFAEQAGMRPGQFFASLIDRAEAAGLLPFRMPPEKEER